jgi:CubicO group peptidase (beta-lactamase class C family)
MNKHKKIIVMTLFCCCQLTACLKTKPELTIETSNDSHKEQVIALNINSLNERIQLKMLEKNVPGMSVLIVQDQEVLFQKSYGYTDLKNKFIMNDNSSVRLASATKVLTGLLIMSLAEDDIIDLNQPFQAYFPDAPDSWSGISLWQILNHTSGIPRFLNSKEFEALSNIDKTKYSHRQAFDYLKTIPLDYQPGENWRYQQSAYSMIAMMLIELTGKSWDELLSEHIFEPARMTSTQYGDSLGEHPVSYVLEDGKLVVPEYYYPKAFSMGGGYNTTINDLLLLFKTLNTNKIVDQDFLFQESTVNERLYDLKSEYYAPATIVKQFGTAHSLGHSGGGGLADIRYFPHQKIGIAVVSNYSGSGVAIDITEHISSLLFGEKISR